MALISSLQPPGRLLDLIRGREKAFANIEFLVLDEADRMLDMGFVPAIRQIVKLLPRKRQTLFFSATLSREIEKLTGEFLQEPETVEIGRRSNPADTVSQSVYEISQHLKPGLLLHLLQNKALSVVLVFTRTKHGADRIARRLEQAGIPTGTIHSNRSQNQRLRALNEFKEGKVRVLVATDIAARGIDVDGISHVVNYDFPPHHETMSTASAVPVGQRLSAKRSASSLGRMRTPFELWSVSPAAVYPVTRRRGSTTQPPLLQGTREATVVRLVVPVKYALRAPRLVVIFPKNARRKALPPRAAINRKVLRVGENSAPAPGEGVTASSKRLHEWRSW